MIQLLVLLVVLGVVFYLVDRFIPMADPFKTGFRILAVVITIVLLLQAFGVDLGLPKIR